MVAEAARSGLARPPVVRQLCPGHRTGTHPKVVAYRTARWSTPRAPASEPVC
ncbi:hypothetical protein [Streptomyces rubrolavendulae]|uniref:Uncharacterized protein n=1 Tax=Streptomyces rubrolavendulae TaxID=285473 RepID=A0A1D8G0Q7_9ACTN|nr:hypothetical protein [Streptomyces rubrolavendulae]AOT59032.1 hypothetical protein A4G23_01858 [Streptomyces rubrolavendulae]